MAHSNSHLHTSGGTVIHVREDSNSLMDELFEYGLNPANFTNGASSWKDRNLPQTFHVEPKQRQSTSQHHSREGSLDSTHTVGSPSSSSLSGGVGLRMQQQLGHHHQQHQDHFPALGSPLASLLPPLHQRSHSSPALLRDTTLSPAGSASTTGGMSDADHMAVPGPPVHGRQISEDLTTSHGFNSVLMEQQRFNMHYSQSHQQHHHHHHPFQHSDQCLELSHDLSHHGRYSEGDLRCISVK